MHRKVYRKAKSAPPHIAPFGEPAGEMEILGQPLLKFQDQEIQKAGGTVVNVDAGDLLPDSAGVWIHEDTFFTAEALAYFLGQNGSNEQKQAVLSPNTPLFDLFQPLSGVCGENEDYPLGLFSGLQKQSSNKTTPVPLEIADKIEEIRAPPFGRPPHVIRFPIGLQAAGGVHHWMHVLHANLVVLYATRKRLGLLGQKNKIGKNVKIHPTALVEGSILEDGAEIEAFASVLQSYIGAKTKIAAHSIFQNCVIGKDCHTLVDTHMRRVVSFSGSTLSNLGIEDLVIGRNVFITTGVGFFQKPPGNDLLIDGELVRRPIIGGAFGHNCILGARALLAAGTSIPSGTMVVMRPDEGLARLSPEGLKGAHMIEGHPERHH
jgi:carbonic anhydrase/acetyltransferase-like protein (isoleucine patch superfamily)